MSGLVPYGPVPTSRQLAWHERPFYGFLHFTVNTFTDREWGYGDESPTQFAPTDFDADQLAETARSAGMSGLILTAKHHDGFCLWPSRYTEHSVRQSDWQGGHGDVVRDVSQACQRAGLSFGVYLSPWDRNHAAYGTAPYVTYYKNQLRELLQEYGRLFEVWFDGANGGDGYYGGARESRHIDKHSYYQWDSVFEMVRDLQPDACIFSDAGPDVRWVGNERGIAGDPCWATLNRGEFAPGEADQERLNRGDRPGTHWLPAECDVSIRPGWFYHSAEDAQVKSGAELSKLYLQSVGRGASLLLNLPPDRRGQIHPRDVAALHDFRRLREEMFAEDVARLAKVAVDPPADVGGMHDPRCLVDGDACTFWTSQDSGRLPVIEVWLPQRARLGAVELCEYLSLGQRVEGFGVDLWLGQAWREVARGQAIGARSVLRFNPSVTDRVRLRVTQSAGPPALSRLSLWRTAA